MILLVDATLAVGIESVGGPSIRPPTATEFWLCIACTSSWAVMLLAVSRSGSRNSQKAGLLPPQQPDTGYIGWRLSA